MPELSSYFNWFKAFHIIFVICWFACLFYLPRLFINYVISDNDATRQQLVIMQRKLYKFSIPFAVLTILTGFCLFLSNTNYYLNAIWFHIKITLIVLLVVYQGMCGHMVKQFAAGTNKRGDVFYRVFNELPVVFVLFPVVILVVVKPF